MNVDIERTRITTPDTVYSPARFVFSLNGDGTGTAAVWTSQRRPTRTASRVLLATGTFTERSSARTNHTFTTESGEVWNIQQLSGGGCGCNKNKNPLAGIPFSQLFDPDFDSVG